MNPTTLPRKGRCCSIAAAQNARRLARALRVGLLAALCVVGAPTVARALLSAPSQIVRASSFDPVAERDVRHRAAERASQAPRAGESAAPRYTVCIDPGHPSEVGRGTTGRHISEIHAAWLVAMKLRSALVARGVRVVLTKLRENQLVRNRARAEIANSAHADLMIRLHCDADAGSGIATYAPDRQGVSGGVRGPDPAIVAASQTLGREFHAALIRSLNGALVDRGFLPDTRTAVGSRQGALTGSIFSRVPVVLVEMCVLTNPTDERFIVRPANQTRLAEAMAVAILFTLHSSANQHASGRMSSLQQGHEAPDRTR